jgi:hypothetical protein
LLLSYVANCIGAARCFQFRLCFSLLKFLKYVQLDFSLFFASFGINRNEMKVSIGGENIAETGNFL